MVSARSYGDGGDAEAVKEASRRGDDGRRRPGFRGPVRGRFQTARLWNEGQGRVWASFGTVIDCSPEPRTVDLRDSVQSTF